MTPVLYLALHEEAWVWGLFSTRELAEAWIASREEADVFFSIEEVKVDDPEWTVDEFSGGEFRVADVNLAAALLNQLAERLQGAEANLLQLAADTSSGSELERLEAKASGVRLALGYVREALAPLGG